MVEDSLQYLVMSEGGATALLATALRPPGGQPSAYHLSIWSALAKQLGLELSELGPNTVLVEDGNLDLVLLWDDWCIVFEVKIRAGSVREGQLLDYYDLLHNGPDPFTTRFAGALKLCLAFLTPTHVGALEFESLVVTPPDRKVHLAWDAILAAMNSALDATVNTHRPSFLEELLRAGSDRIAALLHAVKARSVVAVTDEQRLARRQFALDVQMAVVGRRPEWADLCRPLWTAPTVEEVYLSIDRTRRANVYFAVFSDSAVVPDDRGLSSVQVRFWFKVANRYQKSLRAKFAALDRSEIVKGLALVPDLAAAVELDDDKLSLALCSRMTGPRSQLIADCSAILERLVATMQLSLA